VDPYQYVPSSPELAQFQTVRYYEIYDHKDEFTIYPPVAQMFFAINYLLFKNNPIGMKGVFSIFDIFNGLLILLFIKRIRGNSFQAHLGALLYLWNPLVIIEVSQSGHVDVFAIFLLLVSLMFLSKTAIGKSSIFAGVSIFTKWISILIVPLYLKYLYKKRRHSISKLLLSIVLTSTIVIFPFYLSSGFNFVTSMMQFLGNWRYESSVSRFLTFLIPIKGASEIEMIKLFSYLLFIVIYVLIWYRSRIAHVTDIIEYTIIFLALFYLITPAIYPWYALWMLTLLALVKVDTRSWIGISFSGIVMVNYLQNFYPLTSNQFWTAYVVWFLPVLAILGYSLYRKFRE
jgi:hypothetical protein